MTYAEFIELAKANYTKGGDSFYECWEEYQFNDYVKMFGPITKKKALEMFKQNAEIDAEYEAAAKWYSGMDQETIDTINKENAQYEARKAQEEKAMATNKTSFTLGDKTYEMNEKGNRFFVSYGNIYRKRIAEHVFEAAWDEYLQNAQDDAETDAWQEQADAELKERKDLQDAKDRETEDNFNGKKEQPKTKKVSKPRRSKDVAFEMDTIIGHVTLTEKQVDFLKHLPDTCFWEHGLESALWCDVLADEIGGQFEGKPMTVGAMISTLREKKLVEVAQEEARKGKPKYMVLTVVGKVVAKKLGLN